MTLPDGSLTSRLRDVNLCVITDRHLARGRSFQGIAEEAIRGGAKMIQLRDKELSDREFYQEALKLRALTLKAGVLLVIDDRVDVALTVKADGIHLGEKDLPLEEARKLTGPLMILGASARTPEGVEKAQQAGADYLGIGAMFSTRTKDDSIQVGPERLVQLRPFVKIPILAIGGITSQNAAEVIKAGADGVAVISAVVGAKDIAEAVSQILYRIYQAKGKIS